MNRDVTLLNSYLIELFLESLNRIIFVFELNSHVLKLSFEIFNFSVYTALAVLSD